MNTIEKFQSEEFGTLRTVEDGSKTLFCAKDVAVALGYKDPTNAIKKHCRSYGVAKRHPIVDQLGRDQEAVFIPEGDVYRLIAHSKLPGAERFESWVFDEVLPSIRKHGGYIAASEDDSDDMILARALQIANAKIAERTKQLADTSRKLAIAEPKAAFYDSVMDSDGLLSIRDSAKLMKSHAKDIGQKKLFSLLREDGMIEKRTRRATPKAIERGYLKERPFTIEHSDGKKVLDHYGCLTPKGLDWCIRRYCGGESL